MNLILLILAVLPLALGAGLALLAGLAFLETIMGGFSLEMEAHIFVLAMGALVFILPALSYYRRRSRASVKLLLQALALMVFALVYEWCRSGFISPYVLSLAQFIEDRTPVEFGVDRMAGWISLYLPMLLLILFQEILAAFFMPTKKGEGKSKDEVK